MPEKVAGPYSVEKLWTLLNRKGLKQSHLEWRHERTKRWNKLENFHSSKGRRGEGMESRAGIRTSTSLEQMLGCVGCCWEGISVHLHKQQQPAWQGRQELVFLYVRLLRHWEVSVCTARWLGDPPILCEPSVLATQALAHKTGYPYLRSLSLLCVGLQTPHSFSEGLPAQQHKGAFSSTDLAFVPQGLILWC